MSEKFKVKSIKYNLFMNIILKMSGVIFPLITFPYVSRILLSEANGKLAFATSVVSYFSLVASMGIPSYGIRKCAEVRDDRTLLSKVVKELLILNSIFTILSYLFFFILLISIPRFSQETPLFLITSLSIVFNMLGVEWFYQAIEQYQYITIRNISFKILSILLMFAFVHKPSDYLLYGGINVFASVGSNILNVLRISRYVNLDFRTKEKYEFAIHLMPILTLFLYNATTIIFTSLDQVMLGFMKSNDSVGYYAATIRIKNILVSLITALGAVMLPKISYALKNKSIYEFERMIRKSFQFILFSSIPIVAFFILMAQEIILVLAGDGYLPAVPVLKLVIPSIIFIGLSSVTAWQLLIPLGKEKYTVIGAIVGAVLNLILNFILIPSMGGAGAAIATTFAELAVFLVHVKVLKDIIRKTFEFRELFATTVASILAFSIVFAVKPILNITLNFVACVVFGLIFGLIYIGVLLLFRESLVMEAMQQGQRILQRRKS